MPIIAYEKKPVDNGVSPNPASLAGKSVIVTGGCSGLGKEYVEAFIKAGSYVTIADIDEKQGHKIASGCAEQAQFVKCDVTQWADQVAVFKAAIANSPHRSCDIVIANAGIAGPDPIFQLDDLSKEPVEPNLKIININLTGVLYTTKLALHYFRLQPEDEDRDRCLIIKGSVAGLLDQPGTLQYCASKFGVRGLMRSLRTTSWQQGVRVNLIAPWYIQTAILSEAAVAHLTSKGLKFALAEDAAKAVIHVSSDKSINGRTLAIVPRETNSTGYVDVGDGDFEMEEMLEELQKLVLKATHRIAVPASKQ